eukprot:g1145.t1
MKRPPAGKRLSKIKTAAPAHAARTSRTGLFALYCTSCLLPTSRATDATTLVDKNENPWTISVKFKQDIQGFFRTELRQYRKDAFDAIPTPGGGEEEIDKDCQIGIELGAHVGLTTGFLATQCRFVWALENSVAVLEQNAGNNRRHKNVAYFEFHSVLDSWEEKLPRNHFVPDQVSFVLIDAAHDFESVLSDLRHASEMAPFLVLDDYGAERGVLEAVRVFVEEEKRAKFVRHLGHEAPWSFEDRVVTAGPEGVLLEVIDFMTEEQKRCVGREMLVLAPGSGGEGEAVVVDIKVRAACGVHSQVDLTSFRSPQGGGGGYQVAQQREIAAKVWNTTWLLYPLGVFLSGNIALQGRISLYANQTGTMEELATTVTAPAGGGVVVGGFAAEPLEYRPAVEDQTLENNFVIAAGSSGRRFQVSFQPSYQSGMLWSLAGAGTGGEQTASQPLYVMIKDSLVRTIGEKLLSALY